MRSRGVTVPVVVAVLLALSLLYVPSATWHRPKGHPSGVPLSPPQAANGSFALLPAGITHYLLTGPAEGPLVPFLSYFDLFVVLVHGLLSSSKIFNNLTTALNHQGYRTLSFDILSVFLWLSSAPNALYNEQLFVSQLANLLFKLRLNPKEGRFHLVGLSMGGAIATAFAHVYGDRVEKLILIAPVGGGDPPVNLGLLGWLLKVPLLADVAWSLGGALPLLRSNAAAEFAVLEDVVDRDQLQQFRMKVEAGMMEQVQTSKDYLSALFCTVKDFAFDGFGEMLKNVGTHPRKVLLLWGDKDYTVPYANSAVFRRAMPNADLVTIEGGNHYAISLRAKEINEAIIAFLQE
ncbi:Alpha/beta hydrolase [Balamuthia mandrillaris]